MQPWSNASKETSLWIPRGMIGFPGLVRYRFVRTDEEDPFSLLVSEEKPQVRFSLVDPLLIRPDYDPPIEAGVREELESQGEGKAAIYAVVHTPEDARAMTMNLRAPVLLNERSGIGAQVLLDDPEYPVRVLLTEEWDRERVEMLTV